MRWPARRRRTTTGRSEFTLGDGSAVWPAGIGVRLFARVFDTVVAGIAQVSLVVVVLVGVGLEKLVDIEFGGGRSETGDALVALGAAVLVPPLLLEVVLVARVGQTLGIRIVDHRTGEAPPLLRSLVRWLLPVGGVLAGIMAGSLAGLADTGWGPLAAVCVWPLVYASAIWDRDRRGWHDKASHTIAISTRPPPIPLIGPAYSPAPPGSPQGRPTRQTPTSPPDRHYPRNGWAAHSPCAGE